MKKKYCDREIEDIAWQVFLNRLGLSFKRKLTFDEMLGITGKPEYQQYRDEAIKIYEKKQRALLNKKYPVIEVPASGNAGWMGGAYTLCFVYSKYNGNFVLSGYSKEVQEYLEKNYTHYFYNLSLWSHGMHRDIWGFWKENVGIFSPNKTSKYLTGNERWKHCVRKYSTGYDVIDSDEDVKAEKESLYFKRLPKRWIPEFNKF